MNKWEILNKLYINNGLKIFPVIANGKTPLIKEWQKDCSSNFMQVMYWLNNAKDCNWGLPASENNLFIIDLDVHDPNKNGVENFNKLIEKLFTDKDGFYGDAYDNFEYMEQITPSGGQHIIFETDDDLRKVANCSNAFKDYPGIDIRTDGYIVVEPSTIGDKKYGFSTIPMGPPKMHPRLKKYILENASIKGDSKKTPYVKPTEVEKGDRDNQLFQYINQLYFKNHLDFDEVLVLANYFNENILEEPFTEKEVKYKVKKAFEKSRANCILIRLPEEE